MRVEVVSRGRDGSWWITRGAVGFHWYIPRRIQDEFRPGKALQAGRLAGWQACRLTDGYIEEGGLYFCRVIAVRRGWLQQPSGSVLYPTPSTRSQQASRKASRPVESVGGKEEGTTFVCLRRPALLALFLFLRFLWQSAGKVCLLACILARSAAFRPVDFRPCPNSEYKLLPLRYQPPSDQFTVTSTALGPCRCEASKSGTVRCRKCLDDQPQRMRQ